MRQEPIRWDIYFLPWKLLGPLLNNDIIIMTSQVGDDLRRDIVIIQMIRLMEKIWLRAGLDLKMVTYQCVATGDDQGIYNTGMYMHVYRITCCIDRWEQ